MVGAFYYIHVSHSYWQQAPAGKFTIILGLTANMYSCSYTVEYLFST